MEASEEMEEVAVKEIDEKNDVVSDKGVALSGKPEVLEEKEEEAVKEIIEKNDVGSDKGIVFSGEMEALERKKRRRTEIFLGGIDKDAKEEDIRNVFEQVGEVMEVRLVMNSKTGKNKGFAFLRFASAADAKTALQKYSTVKICRKQCSAQPVEGNDSIFLGNINKKWKSEDVVKLLKDAGIEKIDKVIVMANPSNFELNRGFAFLEFETCKDAQIALSKLQKHDVFVNQMKINVDWAQPVIEPKEEEMLKVKTVYAEYLPPSWDEEKVREFFKRFGEVESITLAKKLPLSKRKDFAFVNYTKRGAALACIEAFGHEQLDDEGSKVKVKLSLAKPIRSVKQMKHVSNTTEKGLEKEKRKASQSMIKVREPRKRGKPASSNLDGVKVDRVASNNDDRLQLFRQQTLVGQTRPGSSTLHHHYGSTRSEQPLSALGIHPLPSDPSGFPRTHLETPHLSGIPSYLPTDPRGFPRTHLETPHLSGIPSAFSHRVGMESFPYSLQPRTSYKLESSYGFRNDPHVNMMRERANYYGHSVIYQRY
ncbi:hypothetical protein ACH5RR_005746 [Cinchona calisaya]|uniref:RRM domain-containing protein n=1 Tax=Cinchona calisaya TaxID=153742 RepID=A0ABD3AM12_9GENT